MVVCGYFVYRSARSRKVAGIGGKSENGAEAHFLNLNHENGYFNITRPLPTPTIPQ